MIKKWSKLNSKKRKLSPNLQKKLPRKLKRKGETDTTIEIINHFSSKFCQVNIILVFLKQGVNFRISINKGKCIVGCGIGSGKNLDNSIGFASSLTEQVKESQRNTL